MFFIPPILLRRIQSRIIIPVEKKSDEEYNCDMRHPGLRDAGMRRDVHLRRQMQEYWDDFALFDSFVKKKQVNPDDF